MRGCSLTTPSFYEGRKYVGLTHQAGLGVQLTPHPVKQLLSRTRKRCWGGQGWNQTVHQHYDGDDDDDN